MLNMQVIVSIYEFENRKKIFSEVDSRYKFMTTYIAANTRTNESDFNAAFYLHDIASLDPVNVRTREVPISCR